MAKNPSPNTTTTTTTTIPSLFQKITNFSTSRNGFYTLLILLVLFDIALSMAILKYIPYTEIDWIAYMQEVGGFLAGERDYTKLRGDTGPLVYPAGFVYIYSGLYWITNQGQNIFLAQCIFAALYILTNIITTVVLYGSGLVSLWVLPIMYISKRLHSIYMLRCFNDCVAMGLMYVAIYSIMKNRWYLGSILVSLALSVKMNILLFFPGLAIIYVLKYPRKIPQLFLHALLIIFTQVVLAVPFLIDYPKEYFNKSFEFGRVFTFIWTVNWKFLPEDIFVGKPLAKGLLLTHLAILLITFAILDGKTIWSLWFNPIKTRRDAEGQSNLVISSVEKKDECEEIQKLDDLSHENITTLPKTKDFIVSNDIIVTRVIISNFIGIVCAKSLHYQFYSWYAHQLPLLLALVWGLTMKNSTHLFIPYSPQDKKSSKTSETSKSTETIVFNWVLLPKLALVYVTFGVIELTWNIFPSTPTSSLLWQIVHWFCLLVILFIRLGHLKSVMTTVTKSNLKSTKND